MLGCIKLTVSSWNYILQHLPYNPKWSVFTLGWLKFTTRSTSIFILFYKRSTGLLTSESCRRTLTSWHFNLKVNWGTKSLACIVWPAVSPKKNSQQLHQPLSQEDMGWFQSLSSLSARLHKSKIHIIPYRVQNLKTFFYNFPSRNRTHTERWWWY